MVGRAGEEARGKKLLVQSGPWGKMFNIKTNHASNFSHVSRGNPLSEILPYLTLDNFLEAIL